MIVATCTFCFTSSGYFEERDRLTCPNCLKNFDPYAEPVEPKTTNAASEATELADLMGPSDDAEPPELALDTDSDEKEVEPDLDFEEGV